MSSSIYDEWKQVPPACIHGITTLWATKEGRVRNDAKIIHGSKGPKGKDGCYKFCKVQKHTLYLHRLIYFAHSGKSSSELLAGTVIFRETSDPSTIIDERGCYRNWFEDLVFIPSPHSVKDTIIPDSTEEVSHPKYGIFMFNKWIPLYTLPRGEIRIPVKSEIYEICFLNNPDRPCLIRNKTRGTIMNQRTNKGHDPAVALKPTATESSINYQLTHILLASAFPTQTALYTVDHINDNPKNNCVLNLQWMTSTENSRKAQSKTSEKRRAATVAGMMSNAPTIDLPDEIWKPLPLSARTIVTYLVSNHGRIKNKKTGHILTPKSVRGRKYTSHTVAIEEGVYKTHNTHFLIYRTFHGEVPVGMDILHNDFAPLNPDGTYRNWAEDFTLGSRTINNKEYHKARRIHAEDTIQLID